MICHDTCDLPPFPEFLRSRGRQFLPGLEQWLQGDVPDAAWTMQTMHIHLKRLKRLKRLKLKLQTPNPRKLLLWDRILRTSAKSMPYWRRYSHHTNKPPSPNGSSYHCFPSTLGPQTKRWRSWPLHWRSLRCPVPAPPQCWQCTTLGAVKVATSG